MEPTSGTELTVMPSTPSGTSGTNDYESTDYLIKDPEQNKDMGEPEYRVYKRRFLVLAELTLLNLATAWAGSSFTALTVSYAEYFEVPISSINLVTSVSYAAFIIPCPLAIWVLRRGGPRLSMMVCAGIFVVGVWITFAGTRARSYGTMVAGNVITAAAQPFVLTAPTRNSKMWFSPKTRTTATAIPSLAYPLGGGIATLLGPVIYDSYGIYGLTLVVSVIATVACAATPFMPASPPTPPSAVEAEVQLPLWQAVKLLSRTPPFYLQFMSFSVFAGVFLSTTGLIVNILGPYGFTSGRIAIAGALMVFVGLGFGLLVSPFLDRYGGHVIVVRVAVTLLAATYTALIFIGQTRSSAAVYFIFALIGVFSFSIEPCVLELQASWTHPVTPEISSSFCWAGAQFCGTIFTVIVTYGINRKQTASELANQPITNGLIFQAVMVWLTVPAAMLTGVGIFKRPAASIAYGQ